MKLGIYVPAGQDRYGFAPRSAIVGIASGNGRILCDHESGPDAGRGRSGFAEQLGKAARRLNERRPGVGQISLPAEALRRVGEYDGPRETIAYLDDAAALDAWLQPTGKEQAGED